MPLISIIRRFSITARGSTFKGRLVAKLIELGNQYNDVQETRTVDMVLEEVHQCQ